MNMLTGNSNSVTKIVGFKGIKLNRIIFNIIITIKLNIKDKDMLLHFAVLKNIMQLVLHLH